MTLDSLRDLYVQQLRYLYDAEEQLVDALPEIADYASDPVLKKTILDHLEQTRQHVSAVEQAALNIGCKLRGRTCKAMKGLLRQGEDMISSATDEARDAAIIAAGQSVEQYEIAVYNTARTCANLLGQTEAESLFGRVLKEEEAASRKFKELALTHVRIEAADQERRVAA